MVSKILEELGECFTETSLECQVQKVFSEDTVGRETVYANIIAEIEERGFGSRYIPGIGINVFFKCMDICSCDPMSYEWRDIDCYSLCMTKGSLDGDVYDYSDYESLDIRHKGCGGRVVGELEEVFENIESSEVFFSDDKDVIIEAMFHEYSLMRKAASFALRRIGHLTDVVKTK